MSKPSWKEQLLEVIDIIRTPVDPQKVRDDFYGKGKYKYEEKPETKTESKDKDPKKDTEKKDGNKPTDKGFIIASSERVLDLSGNGSYLAQFQTLERAFEAGLSFAFFLYTLGLFGRVINRKNFIVTRRAVERRYLGVITSFVLYGVATNDPRGAIYGLLLVILAACESAIGLGIILVLHRFGGTINFQDYEELGG